MTENNQNNGQHNEHWLQHLLPFALIAGLVSLLTIVSSQSFGELQPLIPEENWLTKVVSYLIIGTEGAAAFVIGSGVVRALFTYTRHLLDSTNKQINSTERVRLRLGHMLNLGLEFAMASDILRLTISPTPADFIILFAIVLLRILLNYFLEREIRSSAEFCGPGDYVPPVEE
jgi:uncharacterized membrane protein